MGTSIRTKCPGKKRVGLRVVHFDELAKGWVSGLRSSHFCPLKDFTTMPFTKTWLVKAALARKEGNNFEIKCFADWPKRAGALCKRNYPGLFSHFGYQIYQRSDKRKSSFRKRKTLTGSPALLAWRQDVYRWWTGMLLEPFLQPQCVHLFRRPEVLHYCEEKNKERRRNHHRLWDPNNRVWCLMGM